MSYTTDQCITQIKEIIYYNCYPVYDEERVAYLLDRAIKNDAPFDELKIRAENATSWMDWEIKIHDLIKAYDILQKI